MERQAPLCVLEAALAQDDHALEDRVTATEALNILFELPLSR
jgi:hypothetical protein